MNSLDYAIRMESEGVEFYTEQAQNNKGNVLQKIFEFLASQEKHHEVILMRVLNDAFAGLPDHENLSDATGIFTNLKSFEDEIRKVPPQFEVYQFARDLEQKGIDLYQKMTDEALTDEDKNIFNFLLDQEKQHYQILDDIAILVARPDEWVESAEFGAREEY